MSFQNIYSLLLCTALAAPAEHHCDEGMWAAPLFIVYLSQHWGRRCQHGLGGALFDS